MKTTRTAAAAALALAACSPQGNAQDSNAAANAAAAQRPSDSASEAYMRKAEEDWAALAVRKIPGLMERVLADDYVGVSSKGDVRDKAKQVEIANAGPSGELVA